MGNDTVLEWMVPSALLNGIKFDMLTGKEIEKFSAVSVEDPNGVTDPKMGVPSLSSQCLTCGCSDIKNCHGHFGSTKFPATVYHPYFVQELVHMLNTVCPACKSLRMDMTKGSGGKTKRQRLRNHQPNGCKYCARSANSFEWYPQCQFKLVSRDSSGKKSFQIVAEVKTLPKKFHNKNMCEALPEDYWNFIPKCEQKLKHPLDDQQDQTPTTLALLPYQVFCLVRELDQKFIGDFVPRPGLLFLSALPITPNCSRVMETMHRFSDGSRLIFDDRTRTYKRLVSLKRQVNELVQHYHNDDGAIQSAVGNCVLDCLEVSKLHTKKSSSADLASCMSGSKWMKEILLGKRTDHAFRMTVVGDPKIHLGEIGIPCDIAENMLISEHVNSLNLKKLNATCNLHLLQKRAYFAKINGGLASVCCTNELRIGQVIYRPLEDGDLVLVNRPPSVHQHCLIAFSVKILPTKSVVSINPICCAPFRGDFDGDCLHGYIPQSINCRVELGELVSLKHQLLNGQDGSSVLSLTHDSLTAAYLIMDTDVFLSKIQLQQLQMLCPGDFKYPAICKASSPEPSLWTGKQLFCMLLPQCAAFASDEVFIEKGNVLFSSGASTWLQDIFSRVLKHHPSEFVDFLFAAQDVLCEWISARGFSVSLSDIYLASDPYSRRKLMDEVSSCLQEAEQACCVKQLMGEEGMEHISYDLQNVIRPYASKENSMLAMINAGSKGNLRKLMQQCLCLGLQYPTNLSFTIPQKLSCDMWSQEKVSVSNEEIHVARECAERHASYVVIENSFISGLNPLECFIHSLTSRGNFFSDNADLPGTLTRKLMFYLRDLYVAYDGTVRSAYGQQLIQFSYDSCNDTCGHDNKSSKYFDHRMFECDGTGGQPVGAWSACSISEAAYSALDQPILTPETSSLLNLKKVLDCGRKESCMDKSASLFLSEKLRRLIYGFEYGALEVKNHLERVILSDVVTTIMIIFSKQDFGRMQFSPWVSHFHVCKAMMKDKRLTIQSLADALAKGYNSVREERKVKRHIILPALWIVGTDCCAVDARKDHDGTLCITAAAEVSNKSLIMLDTIRDVLIPLLLEIVVKGFVEFKKVQILWDDNPNVSKPLKHSLGKLFLKVHMSENCKQGEFWTALQNACIPMMDLIDWKRSHSDNVHDIFCSHGIDAAWMYFLRCLKSTLSDLGKNLHLEHLLVAADCLSATGQFHGLNAKGIKRQRDQMSISSPFVQACFTKPSDHFIKAAKNGSLDDLLGTLDTVAWGKEAPVGTGGPFRILYPRKELNVVKPVSVYERLCHLSPHENEKEDGLELKVNTAYGKNSKKCGREFPASVDHDVDAKGQSGDKCDEDPVSRSLHSWVDVVNMHISLRDILHKYALNDYVNDADKSLLMKALLFHPKGDVKIGTGVQDIKIGHHILHQGSRCFILVRTDGSSEDFSYRKCVIGAAKQISPDNRAMLKKIFYGR